jgi:hypothetical protein
MNFSTVSQRDYHFASPSPLPRPCSSADHRRAAPSGPRVHPPYPTNRRLPLPPTSPLAHLHTTHALQWLPSEGGARARLWGWLRPSGCGHQGPCSRRSGNGQEVDASSVLNLETVHVPFRWIRHNSRPNSFLAHYRGLSVSRLKVNSSKRATLQYISMPLLTPRVYTCNAYVSRSDLSASAF